MKECTTSLTSREYGGFKKFVLTMLEESKKQGLARK